MVKTRYSTLCVNTARDYCQWDTFKASCVRRDQLVVMKSAVYGRMASGPCIERDYGYVGCHSDVLHQADARCSGRRDCQLNIPYQPFDVGHPCPKDLTRFLRASFDCVNGKISTVARVQYRYSVLPTPTMSVGVGRIFESVCLSVCPQHNSKNNPKVFKLGSEDDTVLISALIGLETGAHYRCHFIFLLYIVLF